MTFLWLLVWLCNGTPHVQFSNDWNNWAISLVICAGIDVLGGGSAV